MDKSQEILLRDQHNPIITANTLDHPVSAVLNPAAVQMGDETMLLLRVEDRAGVSHLAIARSSDGVTNWSIDEPPYLQPQPERFPEEQHGIEDARIQYLEEMGQYVVTYTSYSDAGPLVSLATTKDFSDFNRVGAVLPPENKDAALFPVRIGGRWAMIHRPVSTFADVHAHIWIAYSDDLHDWGGHRALLPAGPKRRWDSERIGLGPPPMLTDEGWLILYHAVRQTTSQKMYYLGLALLDTEDPTHVICRSSEWMFEPETPYEVTIHGGIVFPCGWIRDGDDVRIYYGAGDNVVALAHGRISELIRWVKEHPTEPW